MKYKFCSIRINELNMRLHLPKRDTTVNRGFCSFVILFGKLFINSDYKISHADANIDLKY